MQSKLLQTLIIAQVIVLIVLNIHAEANTIASGDYFIELISNKDENEILKITLKGGVYYDSIIIKSNTEIYGTLNPVFFDTLIIEGDNIVLSNISIDIVPPGAALSIIIKNSNNATISDINISGGAIIVYNSSNIKIINITIMKVRSPGIVINESNNINILNYKFKGEYESQISICNSKNIIIDNNLNIKMCETQDPREIRIGAEADTENSMENEGSEIMADREDGESSRQDTSIVTDTGENIEDGINRESGKGGLAVILAAIVVTLMLLGVIAYTRKVRAR